MKNALRIISACAALITSSARAGELTDAVAADYDYVFDLYKYFHANPELSLKEKNSAARFSGELEALGFTLTRRVGEEWILEKAKTEAGAVIDGVGGYGFVAVMENGPGPILMLRADMDALPLEEKSGLDYASTVVMSDYKGVEAPVMHACAHDTHMAMMVGAARRLVDMKEQWSGTLIIVGQPGEELGYGAIAMLEDGLYKRFPKPDFVVSMHTSGWDPAGYVVYTPGYAFANVDTVNIYVKGVGTHGSSPQYGKDPVVIGSQIVLALQTLVSRELNPLDAGVVTVGAFNAGYKDNIISDEAHLQLTVRSYKDDVRQHLLDGIERVAIAQARSAGLPKELMPEIVIEKDYSPAVYNDPALTERVMGAVAKSLGEARVMERVPTMGGEDFAHFGRTKEDIPTLIFWVGGNDPDAIMAAREGKAPPPPANHSPLFIPVIETVLKDGVAALTAGALELLAEPQE